MKSAKFGFNHKPGVLMETTALPFAVEDRYAYILPLDPTFELDIMSSFGLVTNSQVY